MAQNLVEHHASVVVNAPVHQVYNLFSHFNDFPKFMSFIHEVTYYDAQRSHWVAEVSGRHEWDAVNEDWIPDRQIGWRSTSGLKNYGRVMFQPVAQNQTNVDVYIDYDPPAGVLGDVGERMGVGRHFDEILQKDLNNFATMVDMAPVNADDPNWSRYLFHEESAAAQGKTTPHQNETMGGEFATPEATQGYTSDPTFMPPPQQTATGMGTGTPSTPAERDDTMANRPVLDRDIINEQSNMTPPAQGQSEIPPEQIPPQQRYDENQSQP